MALALVAVALPSVLRAEEPAAEADLPADVDELMLRIGSCNMAAIHPDRFTPVQLEALRSDVKCDAIANDVAVLRKRYRGNPRILKQLDYAELPAEIDDFIHRRVSCDWLAKKTNEHPSDTKGFEAARLYHECDSVVKDEATLREKYSANPRVLKELDGKWVIVIKRVPLKIAPPNDPAAPPKEQSQPANR